MWINITANFLHFLFQIITNWKKNASNQSNVDYINLHLMQMNVTFIHFNHIYFLNYYELERNTSKGDVKWLWNLIPCMDLSVNLVACWRIMFVYIYKVDRACMCRQLDFWRGVFSKQSAIACTCQQVQIVWLYSCMDFNGGCNEQKYGHCLK